MNGENDIQRQLIELVKSFDPQSAHSITNESTKKIQRNPKPSNKQKAQVLVIKHMPSIKEYLV